MSAMKVIAPGFLSLLQDRGRFGYHSSGLTTSGPMDNLAFQWANRLCSNTSTAAAIEISIGGLALQASADTVIAVTGASMPLTINSQPAECWRSHSIKAGDNIALGYARQGCRAYLAVAGGFQVPAQFGSVATVLREGIGGLDGQALKAGDTLAFASTKAHCLLLPKRWRPKYFHTVTLRTIPSYQQHSFKHIQQRLFYSSEYTVSDRCDRMGYKVNGPAISSSLSTMLSEGICLGAVQIPPDGQPIILMQDRQTIGGYPKIGAVLSLDLAKLAQLPPRAKVHFKPITMNCAHNALHLAHSHFCRAQQQLIVVN